MSTFVRRFLLLPPFLILIVAAAACESSTPTNPTAPAALVSSQSGSLQSSFTAEPQYARPEFRPDGKCAARPAFGVHVIINAGGGHDFVLRRLQFRFHDRDGVHVFPSVFPGGQGTTATSIPTTMPIELPGIAPLPNVSPIPIPGVTTVDGTFIPAGSRRPMPFSLHFGCGVLSEGTVVIVADGIDMKGVSATADLRVRVGP